MFFIYSVGIHQYLTSYLEEVSILTLKRDINNMVKITNNKQNATVDKHLNYWGRTEEWVINHPGKFGKDSWRKWYLCRSWMVYKDGPSWRWGWERRVFQIAGTACAKAWRWDGTWYASGIITSLVGLEWKIQSLWKGGRKQVVMGYKWRKNCLGPVCEVPLALLKELGSYLAFKIEKYLENEMKSEFVEFIPNF